LATNSTDIDDLVDLGMAGLPEALREQADPLFIGQLRMDLRGRQARLKRLLGWFDIDVPVGRLRVVHDGQLVHLVTNDPAHFDALADARLGWEPSPGPSEDVARVVNMVLGGRLRGTEVAYLGDLPAFQQAVLRATASIPRGEVRPYGWVARRAGSAGAVRAAGTALGHNPVPFVVPCHRVVRSDWQLGQYSAGGTAVKSEVLRWEGVDVERLARLGASGARFHGSRKTKTFCLPACHVALSLPPDEVVLLRDEAEARAARLRPCRSCLPV
jgi:O-6-methylguanine DNA methyltransferase